MQPSNTVKLNKLEVLEQCIYMLIKLQNLNISYELQNNKIFEPSINQTYKNKIFSNNFYTSKV
jgi:hypothetical protein